MSYNINEPMFLVALDERGSNSRLIARELVAIGEPIIIDDYSVTVSGLSRYGTFRIAVAPAIPIMFLGMMLMLIGVLWRSLFRRHDVRVWETENGLYVDAWLDMSGRAVGRRRAVEHLKRERAVV